MSDVERARRLHAELPVVDGHADSFAPVLTPEPRDYLVCGEAGHLDLPRQLAAGIDLSIQAVYTPPEHTGDAALAYCLDFTARVLDTLERAAGQLRLIRDVDELFFDGQPPAILLHLEGASPLAGQLGRVAALDALGYRSIGLTHNVACEAAGGCTAPAEEDRLTAFGRDLVTEVDRRGWLLDVAHLGPRSLDQLLEVATGPVISSHTGLASLAPTPRNLTDDQCRALAATGGLIAIDFVPQHLVRPDASDAPYAVDRESLFAHIDRAVELLGDAHVAIGSDFDGYDTPLGGMADGRDYPWLTERMCAAGYTDETVGRILGGNFIRVLLERMARRACLG